MKKLYSLALVLTGCGVGAGIAHVAPAGRAHAQPERCDYTYINDTGNPEIGRAGGIDYDSEWETTLSRGFKLKAVDMKVYVFERCQ